MDRQQTGVERYARHIAAHPYLTVVLSLLLTAACVAGARHIELSTDYRAFFSDENPQLLAFDALQGTFSKNDNIFFVVRPHEGDVFTTTTLTALERFTEVAWQIPYATRVDSLTNFQHTSAQGDDIVVADLVRRANDLSAQQRATIRDEALSDPRLLGRILSGDARTTAVNVTLTLPGKTRKEVPAAVARARELAERLMRDDPNLDVRLTGNVMMSNAMSEASIADMKTLVPAMYGVIVVSVLLILRSWLAALLVSIIIGLSTLSALGLAGWLGTVITPPSASAPTVILTLAVAGSIHVLTTFLSTLRTGVSRVNAVVESLRVNMEPVFLTTLTTMIGFLSMNFSDTPPLRDLGNIAAIGIGAAFFYTVCLLPALVVLFPFTSNVRRPSHARAFEHLGHWVLAWRRPLLGLFLIASPMLIAAVPQLALNDKYVDYFDDSNPFRRDTDFAMEHLTGIYKIEYVMNTGESGGVNEPGYLQHLNEFMTWFRAQPEVVHVHTFAETMKDLNRQMHGGDPNAYRLPESRELAAQYLLMYEMSLPYGLDLNTEISVDKDASRFTVMVKNISTQELLALEKRARHWLEAHTPEVMHGEGTGSSIVFAHMSERSIRSMIFGTGLAIGLIGLILMVALRSVKYGLLSFLTNLMPALLALGIWALTVGEMGFALSVMIAMTLGIIVDDTIHFLSKYIRGRREQRLGPKAAVLYAFSTVGFALVTTTIALVLGFLVLAQSGFLPNAGMATLTVITISIALFVDLVLIPPLLLWIDRRHHSTVLAAERHRARA